MTIATDMLAKYLAAESAVLEGKEVSLGDRKLRMEDLASITAGRKEWERRVQQEAAAIVKAPSIGGMSYSLASFRGQ
ncbi:hypothetical protein [Janthinobacterium sp. HLX7-2]|uniref:hypothetical protein n=1 Tax=Janthinobacterium sp. HLX7-2 TaxID=1259331 RepID=UPI003F220BEE